MDINKPNGLNQKLIGKVLWFGEHQKKNNYGYIDAGDLGEVCIIEENLLASIKRNDIVVFGIRKYNDNKYYAVDIIPLQRITDLELLIYLFIKEKAFRSLLIRRMIYLSKNSYKLTTSEFMISLEEYYCSDLSTLSHKQIFDKADSVYQEIILLFNNNTEFIDLFFEHCTNFSLKIVGWLKNNRIKFSSDEILNIYKAADGNVRKIILSNIRSVELPAMLNLEIRNESSIESKDKLCKYLKTIDEMEINDKELITGFLQTIYNKCSSRLKYLIWTEEDSPDLPPEIRNFINQTFWSS